MLEICFFPVLPLKSEQRGHLYADPTVPLGGLVRSAEQAVMAPRHRGSRGEIK